MLERMLDGKHQIEIPRSIHPEAYNKVRDFIDKAGFNVKAYPTSRNIEILAPYTSCKTRVILINFVTSEVHVAYLNQPSAACREVVAPFHEVYSKIKALNNIIDKKETSDVELPSYYAENNKKGSLYKVAEERGWNAYLFDIVKRLERGGKKDPIKQEITKSIGVLNLWLKELPEEDK